MRVIAKRTLREFWQQASHRDAESPLRAWHREARLARWDSPADVKAQYGTASILKSGRVVFNVGGNKYRPVAWINYQRGSLYVRFIGTHRQYDGINAETI
jgi:mRNA interferase HigB